MAYSSDEYKNSSRNASEELEAIEGPGADVDKRFLEVYIVISLVCLTANILIIFVILKYKRLRQEKWSIIILNWAIINCPLTIISPTTFGTALYLLHLVSYKIFCLVQQIEHILFLADLLLIIILTIYWYLKLYHTEKYVKLCQNIKGVLIFVYVLLIFLAGFNVYTCINRWFLLPEIILYLSELVFILFMAVINIVHAVKMRRLVDYSNRKNIPFLLSNTLFLSYLLVLLVLLTESYFSHLTVQILINVALCIATLNPFYFFMILYHSDRNYNTFFKHLLSCRCKEYNDELVEEHAVSYNNGIENIC
ncbi:kappa-type opioid receptor-like [Anoplophora glabripennis]|uniref:kappa-type opioid receptor-like n=1 Tax=Anoplophora glabripennis TaxID=217634 RepID=UPI0008743A1B|nr:kappa-type opioid receptor-like [Anoplophora glabripennis]